MLVALIVAGGFAIHRFGRDQKASRTFRLAQQALDRCEFKEAAQHLENYLVLRPNEGDTWLLASQTARRLGNYKDAEKMLRTAQDLGVERISLDTERLLKRVQQGNLTQAEALFAYCQANAKAADSALVMEAIIEGSLGVFDLSLSERAIALWLNERTLPFEQARGLVWRARLNDFNNEVDAAVADFNKAIELAPDYYPARFFLAQTLLSHDPRSVGPHLQWLLDRNPDDPGVLLIGARLHRSLGQPEKAIPVLDQLLATRPNWGLALLERARVSLDLQRSAEAEPLLLRAQRSEPQNREVLLALADCARQLGRLGEARGYQEAALKIPHPSQKPREESSKK